MTIWISRELPLFNFERLDMWCSWIGPRCEMLWAFEFLESFCCLISRVSIYSVVQFRASRYVMFLNRTSVWKVMSIWISRELPLFNFERLDMWCTWIGHPTEKLWPFEFIHSFRCSFFSVTICNAPESDIRVKSYAHLNFVKSFRCSISSVSIYFVPYSDIRVKSYDHSNFSWASVF